MSASAAPEPATVPTEPRGRGIATVPNLLTLLRLLCLPIFLYLLFGLDDEFRAAVLLAVLGATDWCDGYVARRFHQESEFGRMFDPTVDRLLFFVGVGGIVVHGSAPIWFCVLVLIREVTVGAVTVVITAMGAKPVHVTWFGKAGTFALMFAFPWFLAGSEEHVHLAGDSIHLIDVWGILAWVAGIPGLVLSYYSAALYVPQWRRNLREARAARHGTGVGPAAS